MSEIGSSLNELDFSKEKIGQRVEFEMADFLFLEKNNIGLRHVSNKREAEDNINNGFRGDDLVLGNIGRVFLKENQGLFDNNDKAKRVLDVFKTYKVEPCLEGMARFFGSEDEKKINDLMHSRLISFIKDSFNINNSLFIKNGEMIKETMVKLKEASAFVLVNGENKNSGLGYDNESYYGLGKFGVKQFGSEDILSSVCGDEVMKKLEDQNLDQTATTDENFFGKAAEAYYELIVEKVKEERTRAGV